MKPSWLAAVSTLFLSLPLIAEVTDRLRATYEKAFQELSAGNYGQALETWDQFDSLASRPADRAEALNLRGTVLMRKREYTEAQDAFEKALDLAPTSWNARFNLAEIPFRQKNWSGARIQFEAALFSSGDDLDRDTRHLLRFKILLTYLLEDNEQAANQIKRDLEGSEGSPALFYACAAIARHCERSEEAEEWTAKAKQRFPASVNKIYAQSFVEIEWERKPPLEPRETFAIESIQEQAHRLHDNALLDLKKAEKAHGRHEVDLALEYLDQLDALSPNEAGFYNLRGTILLERKRFQEAEIVFQKAALSTTTTTTTVRSLFKLPHAYSVEELTDEKASASLPA